jgi:3-hydroxyacyl-CoA dehydrogenase/enoyl-CoA hydratase/3-hydroxybutyryl-CoA epimerase
MARLKVEIVEGVAHLILDDPGKKVNTLGREVLAEFSQVLEGLRDRDEVKAVVIRSAKPAGFLAGADIEELGKIAASPNPQGPAFDAAQAGQALMNKVEDFPKPVVAAVHGTCLGGGLELALACTARVVVHDSSGSSATRMGLPEISLGILPGFGGTYRLPRLIGLLPAVEAILSSKPFDARKALKSGLADDACAVEQLPAVAQEWALKLVSGRRPSRSQPLSVKALQWPGLKQLALRQARKQVLAKTHGNYPAPLRFLDLVKDHHGKPRDAYLRLEAEALADLMATPACASLIRLFFLGQEAKKQVSGQGRKVENVGVVGSGFMGSGIAIPLVDKAGVKTVLKDSDLGMLGKALKKAWDYEMKRVKRRQTDMVTARHRFQLLSAATGYDSARRADLVIEAVPEVLDLKKKIFAELEASLGPQAILASNTSTLPIAQIAEGAQDPSRYVGMHFFSPAEVMPLVEVIPGPATSVETLATTVDLALKMGKTPVVVKDSPGFLVNRILLPYALEAAQMVQEGVPVAQVDRAAVDFGMPMGPIRLIGEVGVPVMLKAMHLIQSNYSGHMVIPAWAGHPDLAKAFRKGKDGKWRVDERMIESWAGKANPHYPALDIQDRLFHAMLNESARGLDEGLVAGPGLLDLAMVYGTGFPPFKGGPLWEADRRGLPTVLARGRGLARTYHARLEPAELIVKKGTNRERFYS